MLDFKQYKNQSVNNIQFNNDVNLFYELKLLEHTKALYKDNFKVVLLYWQNLTSDKTQPVSQHKSLAKKQELQLVEVFLTVV